MTDLFCIPALCNTVGCVHVFLFLFISCWLLFGFGFGVFSGFLFFWIRTYTGRMSSLSSLGLGVLYSLPLNKILSPLPDIFVNSELFKY